MVAHMEPIFCPPVYACCMTVQKTALTAATLQENALRSGDMNRLFYKTDQVPVCVG
jgi:hypothetical protein